MATQTTPSVAEKDQKKSWKRPKWSHFKGQHSISLKSAISLSLNVAPSWLDTYVNNDEKHNRWYSSRLDEACSELHRRGRISVIDKGTKDDKSDCVIELPSFVDFATNRWERLPAGFKQLPDAEQSTADALSENKPSKRHVPKTFQIALIKVLVDIAYKAGKKDVPFDIKNMPGVKENLLELMIAGKYHRHIALGTLDTYIQGYCQFHQGAQSSDFYRDLFPEHNTA